MAAPPAKSEISAPYPNPSNDAARTGFGRLYDYVTGLLGATGNAPEARTALGVNLISCVRALRGNVNATTPLTKFDLSSNEVVLRDANGGTVRRTTGTALTCDLGLAGAAANGRDQAGAFAANSWAHLYYIWNGTTLATIASLSATAPILPSGYTHWAYATTIRWNASSNIIPVLAYGRKCWYVADDFSMTVVSSIVTATFITASCAQFVPPNALAGIIRFWLNISNNTNLSFVGFIRPTGSTLATGRRVVDGNVWGAGIFMIATSIVEIPLDSLQRFDVRLSSAPTSGGLSADVYGYAVPNGDS